MLVGEGMKTYEFVDEKEMPRLKDMLKELLAVEEGLTNGEIDFLDKCNVWEGCFTKKMAGWLEKIYERVC